MRNESPYEVSISVIDDLESFGPLGISAIHVNRRFTFSLKMNGQAVLTMSSTRAVLDDGGMQALRQLVDDANAAAARRLGPASSEDDDDA